MLEFIFLLIVALLCYCIPLAGKSQSKENKQTTEKVADSRANKTVTKPSTQTIEPQSEQQKSVDSLYLDEDFDIYDLINAGKEKTNDDSK